MPSLFVRLDASLEGGDLGARLSVQGQNLASVAGTVAGLINNPPTSLRNLGAAINEFPLPNLNVGGDLAATLGSIRAAVPTDLGAVTGELTGGLATIGATVQTDIVQPLNAALEAVLAVHRLTQLDLTCSDVLGRIGGAAAGAGGAAAGAGAAGGGAAGAGAPGGDTPPAEAGPTGVAAATAQVDAVRAVLDAAPEPFNVVALLDVLRTMSDIFRVNGSLSLPLPVVSELIDPLQTLHDWNEMQPDGIRAHMDLSLQDLTAFVRDSVDLSLGGVADSLTATLPGLHAGELAEIASTLTLRLGELRAATLAGDLGGTGAAIAEINARLDEYAALRTTLQADLLPELAALEPRLVALPDSLVERTSRLLAVLRPGHALAFLEQLEAGADSVDLDAARSEIEEQLRPLVEWLEDLAEKLDLSAVQQPLTAVAEALRGSVDTLEQGLAGVVVQVRSLFDQVERLLDGIDTQALQQRVEAALQGFATQLNQQLVALFQPARAAVAQVVQSIGEGIDAFDPQEIIAALQQAIQSLADVLDDPEVLGALNQIRNAIETATTQLEQLSFAPITDEVIAAIDEVTEALERLDPDQLPPAMQGALQVAVAVLPEDLAPITGPITVEFDGLIAAGPVPLLETVRAQPQRLLQRIRSFEPATLVGDALAQPHRQLLTQMEAFQPSKLLEPVGAELDRLKQRLRTSANPGAPLALLEPPFQQLMQGFDRLEPGALVQPLDDAVRGVIDTVLEALPVDEVFGRVDAVLGVVGDVVTFGEHLERLLERLAELFDGFRDARTQFEEWVDGVLDKVEAMDTAPLAPRFAALTAAVDGTRSTSLAGRFDTAAEPVQTALETLNPQARLNALVQAHGTFPRVQLAALPDSTEKAALVAALGRFDPLDPAFSAPYRALASYRQRLQQARGGLTSLLGGWDARYHADGGRLAGLRVNGATPAELRQWIHDAIEPQFIRPVRALASLLEPVSGPFGGLLASLRTALATLRAKLDDLLLGPNSLGGIRDALRALVDRLRNFNLGFLREALEGVFGTVRGKAAAVDPARLRALVEGAFDDVLDTITLNQILPPADIAALDAAYAALIDKLRALDPQALVVSVIQPEFDAKLLPLLASFDLSPLLDALLVRLRSLGAELRAELERVNQEYRELRDAVPSLSLSVSVDISF